MTRRCAAYAASEQSAPINNLLASLMTAQGRPLPTIIESHRIIERSQSLD